MRPPRRFSFGEPAISQSNQDPDELDQDENARRASFSHDDEAPPRELVGAKFWDESVPHTTLGARDTRGLKGKRAPNDSASASNKVTFTGTQFPSEQYYLIENCELQRCTFCDDCDPFKNDPSRSKFARICLHQKARRKVDDDETCGHLIAQARRPVAQYSKVSPGYPDYEYRSSEATSHFSNPYLLQTVPPVQYSYAQQPLHPEARIQYQSYSYSSPQGQFNRLQSTTHAENVEISTAIISARKAPRWRWSPLSWLRRIAAKLKSKKGSSVTIQNV